MRNLPSPDSMNRRPANSSPRHSSHSFPLFFVKFASIRANSRKIYCQIYSHFPLFYSGLLMFTHEKRRFLFQGSGQPRLAPLLSVQNRPGPAFLLRSLLRGYQSASFLVCRNPICVHLRHPRLIQRVNLTCWRWCSGGVKISRTFRKSPSKRRPGPGATTTRGATAVCRRGGARGHSRPTGWAAQR